MPEDRRQVFPVVAPNPTISMDETDRAEYIAMRTVTVDMPDWATPRMIREILRIITEWRRNTHVSHDELEIYVPRAWITGPDRERGSDRGGWILGVLWRYDHVRDVIVGKKVPRDQA